MRQCSDKTPSISNRIFRVLMFSYMHQKILVYVHSISNHVQTPHIYNATAKKPARAAAMPISSFPVAPVDSGMPAELVALLGPVGLLGDPVMDGEVELPDGITIMLPEAV
jgi:hypothetical protein